MLWLAWLFRHSSLTLIVSHPLYVCTKLRLLDEIAHEKTQISKEGMVKPIFIEKVKGE
jgi:hypothetical protein